MIEINLDEYYLLYEDIAKTIIRNNDILPVILENINVPTVIINNIDIAQQKWSNELEEKYVLRRKEERLIFDSSKKLEKCEEELEEYHEKELKDFIKKYPQFKSIITE